MSDSAPPTRVRCTYRDCNRFFPSGKEMKKHKKDDPEHEYCSRCDEDFDDDEHLLIHKIKSDKHVVCPICGLEFRSEGGRDGHIRQCHRTKQDLQCFGCKLKFTTASSLMRHVEQGECPIIKPMRVLQEQSKKLMIKEALHAGESYSMPVIPNPSDAAELDIDGGGVSLNPREAANREAMSNQPSRPGKEAPSTISAMLALKHWPALGDKAADDSAAAVNLLDSIDLPLRDNKGWREKENQIPVNPIALSEISPVSSRTFGVGIPEAGQTIRAFHQSWDPTKWFNSFSGEYMCPCGKGFAQREKFEEHVLQKAPMARQVQCPGCQRIFKSTSALVAHLETGSSRCDMSGGNYFGQLMDELTGGVIQVAGYNADGTVKYEAGELELQETTTVGVDLDKKW
ncbi:C2H2 finger domain protein [Aspergillus terreus]|uniref:C2H2 finger domain protein n=1 Tax=Aspergillus terreus TaxID=33178 RepID=A0A5M3YVM6_ASPTE|nr:hypothetical protein ATETN484_0004036900 [Aspergillus terreus]GFF13259.1 C2H2 finger domain protein [Aspergillus terreus]